MRRAAALLAAWVALLPGLATAGPGDPREREGHLFMLRIQGGSDADINYAAYHAVPGDRSSLIVIRSLGVLSEDERIEVSARSCPGLRAAVEALEQTPWPAIVLEEQPVLPYLEPEQATSYVLYGALGYANAMSWETKLYFLDRHDGRPRDPFVTWASSLVRVVDGCVARQGASKPPLR